MRNRMIVILWLAMNMLLKAQVTVELDFEKDHYIPNETMLAQVRITNFSGQTLRFGKDNHWLRFAVERQNGFLVDQDGEPNVSGEFEIPNASRATRRVNLAPYFKMTSFGSYYIVATIFCDPLNEVLQSPRTEVNIIHATTLWKKDFGVSADAGYEVRSYSLIRALNRNQLELYVRVATRDASKVFGVFSVGNLVSFGSPEAQIDSFSRLHLLQQYAARSFRYLVVTPDGELMIRQRHDYSQSRPRLGKRDKGIAVLGGIRVLSETDLPPSLETFDSSISQNIKNVNSENEAIETHETEAANE